MSSSSTRRSAPPSPSVSPWHHYSTSSCGGSDPHADQLRWHALRVLDSRTCSQPRTANRSRANSVDHHSTGTTPARGDPRRINPTGVHIGHTCHARVTNSVDASEPQGPDQDKRSRLGPRGRQKTDQTTCATSYHRDAPGIDALHKGRTSQDPDQARANSAYHREISFISAGQKYTETCTTSRPRTFWCRIRRRSWASSRRRRRAPDQGRYLAGALLGAHLSSEPKNTLTPDVFHSYPSSDQQFRGISGPGSR